MDDSDLSRFNRLTYSIIGAALDVHTALGAGLLERVYVACLRDELERRGHRVACEVPLPVRYKGRELDAAFRIDMVVDDVVLIEVKALAELHPVHFAQILSYLRLSELPLGLLVNFNVPSLRDGIHRIARPRLPDSAPSASSVLMMGSKPDGSAVDQDPLKITGSSAHPS